MTDTTPPRIRAYEAHRDLERVFAAFLREQKGYPEATLGFDVPLTGRFRPDLLIVDPASHRFLAIVEFKAIVAESFSKNQQNILAQLLSYRAAAGDLALPVFLVTSELGSPGFNVLRPNASSEWELIGSSEFPTFEALRAYVGTIKVEETLQEQAVTAKKVSAASFLLALLVAVLMVSAVAGLWTPTWEKLSLVAGFVALLLFPEVRKLKVAGIELERDVAGRRLISDRQFE